MGVNGEIIEKGKWREWKKWKEKEGQDKEMRVGYDRMSAEKRKDRTLYIEREVKREDDDEEIV
jgi:hypothetical protein